MDSKLVRLLILGLSFIVYTHGELCYHQYDGYEFCDECCGSLNEEYCCEDDSWVVGVAVGCTLGVLFLVGLVVAIICICIKQAGKSSRVIQPNYVGQPATTSTVIYQTPYAQQQGAVHMAYTQPYGVAQAGGGALPPVYPPPPPTYTPSTQGTNNVPEGIQSQPPVSGGLPGNHKIV